MTTIATLELDAPDRMSRRREQRRKIAELEVTHRRFKEILDEVVQLDRRADGAVENHQTTCAPIQEELTTIENQIVAHLSNREPVPPAVEVTRSKLLRQLSDANVELETGIAGLRAAKQKLAGERDGMGENSGRLTVLRNSLAALPLASPKLYLERLILESKLPYVESWAKRSRERVQQAEDSIVAEQRNRERLTREMLSNLRQNVTTSEALNHVETLQIISSAAAGEMDDCRRQLAQLHEDMINE